MWLGGLAILSSIIHTINQKFHGHESIGQALVDCQRLLFYSIFLRFISCDALSSVSSKFASS